MWLRRWNRRCLSGHPGRLSSDQSTPLNPTISFGLCLFVWPNQRGISTHFGGLGLLEDTQKISPPQFSWGFVCLRCIKPIPEKKTWWKLHETRRFTTFWWSVIPWCVVCFPYLKSPRWPRGKTPPRYAMARGQAIQAREYACPGLRPGVESWSWKRERGRSDPKMGRGMWGDTPGCPVGS